MLEAGIYGSEFAATKGPFEFRCGQMRSGDSIAHNGGWYNHRGEKLGFGDLSLYDLMRVCRDISDSEAFIVLSESDSFWNFVTEFGAIGSMCAVKPEESNPGIDYVLEHARYIVLKDWISRADSDGWDRAKERVRQLLL